MSLVAAADDCGQPRAIVNKSKNISQSLNQSDFVTTVTYVTVNNAKDCIFSVNNAYGHIYNLFCIETFNRRPEMQHRDNVIRGLTTVRQDRYQVTVEIYAFPLC